MDSIKTIKQNMGIRLAYLDKSLSELCHEYDESAKAISGWLKHGNPVLSNIDRLAEMLGIRTCELLDPDYNPKS